MPAAGHLVHMPSHVYMRTGDYAAAVQSNAHAVAADRAYLAQTDQHGVYEIWTKAVAVQDALAYGEPPDWYHPARESLGATLLGAGRAGDAEAVFRADLERNPRSGWSLFGLWKSLEAQKTVDRRIPGGIFRGRPGTRLLN